MLIFLCVEFQRGKKRHCKNLGNEKTKIAPTILEFEFPFPFPSPYQISQSMSKIPFPSPYQIFWNLVLTKFNNIKYNIII